MTQTTNTRLEALRAAFSEPPSPHALEHVAGLLGGWPDVPEKAVGVVYALEHLRNWPEPIRRLPTIMIEAIVQPHIPDGSPLGAVLRPYSTDGYIGDQPDGLPFASELVWCESCERTYEDNPRLWIGWSGSSITCAHCFFSMHYGFADSEFVAEISDQSGERVGGLEGYIRRFVADHDPDLCFWDTFDAVSGASDDDLGCFLCDAIRAEKAGTRRAPGRL